MKVYVALREYDYEGTEVIGVYATRESADAGCEGDRENHPYLKGNVEWSVEEFDLLGTAPQESAKLIDKVGL